MGARKKAEGEVVTRGEAASILGVSTRTVDRYIRSGRLSSYKINRSICLKKAEILKLISRIESNVSSADLSIESTVVKGSERGVSSVQRVSSHEVSVDFEKLYLKLKSELDSQRMRTEMVSQRVYNLEIQLKKSVPMIEYQKIQKKSQKERVIKWILILILLIIISLQPLWLLKAFE